MYQASSTSVGRVCRDDLPDNAVNISAPAVTVTDSAGPDRDDKVRTAGVNYTGGGKVQGKRPKTLIDPNKERRVLFMFSGHGYDVHKDILPEILKFRPDGWSDVTTLKRPPQRADADRQGGGWSRQTSAEAATP